MRTFTRLLVAASLLVLPAASLLAQAASDPSGHWEGSIQAGSNLVMKVEVDLGKNSKGEFAGTFGQPDQDIKGLPLATLAVANGTVRFVIKGGGDPAMFEAKLSADGKALSGEVSQAGNAMPFTLSRTGDARFAPVPKSAPIAPELEGTWNGTLDVGGRQERLVLTLTNRSDGTSAGTVVDLDGSGVEIPVGITQKASNVTIAIPAVGGSYSAVLNAGIEMVGTWTQGTMALPVTFRRSGK